MAGGLAGLAAGVLAWACSTTPTLSFDGEDASSSADVTSSSDGPAATDAPAQADGGAGDAPGEGATPDGGGPDAAPDAPVDAGVDAPICGAGTYFCATASGCVGNCKNNCGGNNGAPIECVGCNDAGAVAARQCVAGNAGASCFVGGVTRCKAPNDVNECPAPRQVRINNECYGCGEATTNGLDCKGGDQCTAMGGNAYECR